MCTRESCQAEKEHCISKLINVWPSEGRSVHIWSGPFVYPILRRCRRKGRPIIIELERRLGSLLFNVPKNEPPKFVDATILNVPDTTLKFIKTFRSNLRDCSVGAFHEDAVSVVWGITVEGIARKRLPIV